MPTAIETYRLRWPLGLLVVASGLFLLIRFWNFALNTNSVQAYHVESAAVVFCASLLLAVFARTCDDTLANPVQGSPVWWLAGFAAASVAFYFPILFTGQLSDDFVLLARTDQGLLGQVTPALHRPVVMSGWALIRWLGATPFWLHLLNVALHGVVAALAVAVMVEWFPGRYLKVACGLLVLTHPAAVEAVAWISGAFDVVATLFVLVGVLIARRYAEHPTPFMRIGFVAIAVCAVLSKETAVVLPLLVVVDHVARRRLGRLVLIDCTLLLLAGLVYATFRLSGTAESETFAASRYVAQRVLFQTFGPLAQPWPGDARGSVAGLAGVFAVIALAVTGGLTLSRQRLRSLAAAGVWTLLAVAPVAGWMFVGSYLEGSRYLYLALPAWSGLAVAMTSGCNEGWRRALVLVLLSVAIVCNALAARERMTAWQEAARIRDAVIVSVVDVASRAGCRTVHVEDLPDSVRGAYVFRNGFREAMESYGLELAQVTDAAACHFHWSPDDRRVVRR